MLRIGLLTSRSCLGVQKRCKSGGIIPIKRILIANRGEIAIRVARACRELDIVSVGIFSHADRYSLHRSKLDEAYEIGKREDPLGAYLTIPYVVELALKQHIDAIHPGYGFLSERADFAQAISDAGIRFIGPAATVMARMGDKVAARRSAIEAGVPVIPGTALSSAEEAEDFARQHGTPIIIKAAFGGGGRGMRRVDDIAQVKESFHQAAKEALTSCGDATMFVEKYLTRPRHIEVQLIGDNFGNVVHLYERDCSVQRRHQKVVEIAPAPQLDPKIREQILGDALKLARHVGYQNAGTVEFLLDQSGKHYFMEVNARLQVEHTVTEEITGIDLVQSQIRVTEDRSLPEMGISQELIRADGVAIQCRLTTEDPAKQFQPDSGKIEQYSTGEGMGIRLDGAAYSGAVITPFYDSLLTKVVAKGRSHQDAVSKITRALRESEIRGIKVNVPFLLNVLQHPDFVGGFVDTSFIDSNPQLFTFPKDKDPVDQLLSYLAEITVNGLMTKLSTDLTPSRIAAPIRRVEDGRAPPTGWRDVLKRTGPAGLSKAVREHRGLLVTDTTFRDAHQSLLATRVRTYDLMRIAPQVAATLPQLFSLEMWGGATYDVCLQFLRECPWDRLHRLREAIPNILFQCLVRGANAVGYQNYPDNVVHEFTRLSVQAGMDLFRVFDCLNYLPNLQVGIEAIHKAGGVVEAAISYSGDIMDKSRKKYTLDYYLQLAEELVKMDIHILAIKDMAGVLKPAAAKLLIGELRHRYPALPIHLHTHDTAGVAVATCLAGADAGADIVDCAVDSMSGMTSQGSMGAVVNAVRGSERDTAIEQAAMSKYNSYWEQTRRAYAPFECTTAMRSGNSDVFSHEIPGGQYTNLQFQSVALNLGAKFPQVCENYRQANLALGDVIKVTPSSKVVGDLSQVMTQKGFKTAEELLDKADQIVFPTSVVEFFEGKLGQPHGGWPKELQEKVLRGREPISERPGSLLEPLDLNKVDKEMEEKLGKSFSERDRMSSILFPKEFEGMVKFRERYGPVDRLPTDVYFCGLERFGEIEVELEPGRTVLLKLTGVGELSPQGEREVRFDVNGQPRRVTIRDKSVGLKEHARRKATDSNHVGAPMVGTIVEMKVKKGQMVKAKQPLCVLSAMKMLMAIEAPRAGQVGEIVTELGESVQAEDLLFVIKE